MKKISSTWALLFCILVSLLTACPSTTNTPIMVVTANASELYSLGQSGGAVFALTGSATVHGSTMIGGTYSWTTKSAPAGAVPVFSNDSDANTTVTNLKKAGTYIFELKATSDDGITGSRTVTVNVQSMMRNFTVSEISSVTNPLDFGTVSSLFNGFDTTFKETDLTYTLTLSQGGTAIYVLNSTSLTSIDASTLGDGIYTVTQTFYFKGSIAPPDGSRSAALSVYGNLFTALLVSETVPTLGKFNGMRVDMIIDSVD